MHDPSNVAVAWLFVWNASSWDVNFRDLFMVEGLKVDRLIFAWGWGLREHQARLGEGRQLEKDLECACCCGRCSQTVTREAGI